MPQGGIRLQGPLEQALLNFRSEMAPANDSVLDSTPKKIGRMIARALGVDDPASQAMGIAAPLDAPLRKDVVRKMLYQLTDAIPGDLKPAWNDFTALSHAPAERAKLINYALTKEDVLPKIQRTVRDNLGSEFPMFRGKGITTGTTRVPMSERPPVPQTGNPVADARSFSFSPQTANNFTTRPSWGSSQFIGVRATPESVLFPGLPTEYELLLDPNKLKDIRVKRVDVAPTPQMDIGAGGAVSAYDDKLSQMMATAPKSAPTSWLPPLSASDDHLWKVVHAYSPEETAKLAKHAPDMINSGIFQYASKYPESSHFWDVFHQTDATVPAFKVSGPKSAMDKLPIGWDYWPSYVQAK